MNISLINGSPRKNGSTAKVLQEIKSQLEKFPNVNIQWYELSEQNIEICKGCEACYVSGKCTIKTDNFETTAENIKNSDGIIIGTPTHGSNVSTLLKNFMDRGHFIVEQSLYNKKCMSVVTYEIAEGGVVLNMLNKFFRVSGGSVAAKLLVKNTFNQNPLTPKLKASISKKVKQFHVKIAKNKRKSLFEYIFNDIIVVSLIWKPYFKKNKKQYKGVVENYAKNNIHPKLVKAVGNY